MVELFKDDDAMLNTEMEKGPQIFSSTGCIKILYISTTSDYYNLIKCLYKKYSNRFFPC